MPKHTKIVSFEDARNSRRATEQETGRREGQSSPARRQRDEASPSWYDAEAAREEAARRDSSHSAALYDGESLEEETTGGAAEDARGRRRKRRSKARAERMFDRQFGGDGASDADGPRAALYKGKMGSSQRKASRMQGAPSAVASKFSIAGNAAGAAVNAAEAAVGSARHNVSHLVKRAPVGPLTPHSLRVLTVVACLVFACVFLYTPAQQYYHAQRDHARLEAEYSSIESRNEALDVQNDILVSDAGMEDSVRRKFGYVKKGEETAIVTGLSDEATDTSRDSEHLEANVLSSSVKAPEEWYTPFLDALFGVE